MVLRPYEQGHLDYYCGPYSIANALKLIDSKFDGEESTILFQKIICFLERKSKLRLVTTRGTLSHELEQILNDVVSRNYSIKITKPFPRKDKTRINQILTRISDFLQEDSRRAVITSIYGHENDLEHWSVIKKITSKGIYFFDSSGITKIYRRRFTTSLPSRKKPYAMKPNEIYFIEKEPKVRKRGGQKDVSAENKR